MYLIWYHIIRIFPLTKTISTYWESLATGDHQVFGNVLLSVEINIFRSYLGYLKAIERINSVVPTMMFKKVIGE